MKIKGIIEEDFVNYKLPCLYISLGSCDWKCCYESNIPVSVCQNSNLAQSKDIDVSIDEIFNRYISNPISEAIVIVGLEPFKQFDDVYYLIKFFRDNNCSDTFIIYTGYYEYEIFEQIKKLESLKNIILKVGRYIPNQQPHYDEILGIKLASDNQKGVIIC